MSYVYINYIKIKSNINNLLILGSIKIIIHSIGSVGILPHSPHEPKYILTLE